MYEILMYWQMETQCINWPDKLISKKYFQNENLCLGQLPNAKKAPKKYVNYTEHAYILIWYICAYIYGMQLLYYL